MAGFGRAPFGHGPFGKSDVGKDLVIDLFPDSYFDDSVVIPEGETVQDNSVDPLSQLLQTYANSVFQRRIQVDNMQTLTDPDTMPLSIVQLWGTMLGLDIDQNDPDFLQRSFLKTASQWLQIKASTKGYEVRGLASGFTVQVVNFWRIDPIYVPLIPSFFVFKMKPPEADPDAVELYYTSAPPGTYPGTPTQEDGTYAKSSFIRVVFSVPIYRPGVNNYNTLLNQIILKIRDVVGIHHELLPIEFEVEIPVDERDSLSVSIRIDEVIEVFNFPEACYFDIIPADFEALDGCLQAFVFPQSEQEQEPINAVPRTSIEIQESVNIGGPSAVPGSNSVSQETAVMNAYVSQLFDVIPADLQTLDEFIYVVDTAA